MKKKKTIFSKTDIENLICSLQNLYPKLYEENILNFNQAKEYFLELDLLVRSGMFKNTLLDVSDSLINLPRKKESDFIGKLRSKKEQLKEVFHELVIGNFFQNHNYKVTYQPNYPFKGHNNTDWEIEKSEQRIIIEVFTLNKYEDYNNEQFFILLLTKRLKKIENQYNVIFDFNRGSFDIKSIIESSNLSNCINNILVDIEFWLKHNSNVKKSNHHETLFGLEIIALHNSKELGFNSKMLGVGVHSYRLSEPIKKKYETYKELVRRNKTPFIIACITDNLPRLSMDCFRDIIFGIPPSSYSKNKDGVINKQNKLYEVSGFMLFDLNVLTNQIDYEYIQNPNSYFPIELELMRNKKCDIRKNDKFNLFI